MFTEVFGFKSFSAEHGFVVCLFIVLTIVLIQIGRKGSPERAEKIGLWYGWTIFGFEILWLLHKIADGSFTAKDNVPLDLCNVLAFLIPFAMRNGGQWWFQIVYAWVMMGTLQGVITPDLDWAFPYIGYLKYWAVHAGLVSAMVYVIVVWGWRPTLNGVFRAWFALYIWAGMAFCFNLWAGSNYGFLMHKPPVKSVFDFLGEHYIFFTQFTALAAFLLFYLPFAKRTEKLNWQAIKGK
jgi:hypothetical integral membrane protein (TIGR02206 family)